MPAVRREENDLPPKHVGKRNEGDGRENSLFLGHSLRREGERNLERKEPACPKQLPKSLTLTLKERRKRIQKERKPKNVDLNHYLNSICG